METNWTICSVLWAGAKEFFWHDLRDALSDWWIIG